MIVPAFWAEAKTTLQTDDRQITLKRFGWSDEGSAAAQTHADERLADAVAEHQAGQSILPREPKVPYNGADGLPIREEIVSRRGEAIVTRNNYGALCLNTPNVLFADVDCRPTSSWLAYFVAIAVVAVGLQSFAWAMGWGMLFFIVLFLSMMIGPILASVVLSIDERLRGNPLTRARRSIQRFANRHPDWHLRLYRTPAGWRVLVMHDVFDPRSDLVHEFFERIGTDWLYVRMCFNQNCFRARVSPKPWRIGMRDHLKPRPGVWPIDESRLPERAQWVRRYDRACEGFAACRFEAQIGPQRTCDAAREVQRWHDELCQAHSNQPIA